jgi:hypothetical protein
LSRKCPDEYGATLFFDVRAIGEAVQARKEAPLRYALDVRSDIPFLQYVQGLERHCEVHWMPGIRAPRPKRPIDALPWTRLWNISPDTTMVVGSPF